MTNEHTNSRLLLTDGVYNWLKHFVQYILPGLGTLYFTLSQIWELQYGEQVLATTSAAAIFLGVVMGVSTNAYNKSGAAYDGILIVDDSDPNTDVLTLQPFSPPEVFKNNDRLVFKIASPEVKQEDEL